MKRLNPHPSSPLLPTGYYSQQSPLMTPLDFWTTHLLLPSSSYCYSFRINYRGLFHLNRNMSTEQSLRFPFHSVSALTRRMAQYVLRDDDKQDKLRGRISRGRSDYLSQKPSTPARKMSDEIYVTSLEGMNSNRHAHKFEFSERPNSFPLYLKSQNISFCSNQDQVLQLDKIKQDQQCLKGEEESVRRRRQARSRKNKSRCHGDRAPSLLQQTGSGMRAIFLGGSGSRNGSLGTGVFLPSAIGKSFESGQQRGFSTVLIPTRVVQALTLHFDKIGAQSRPDLGCVVLHHQGSGRRDIINTLQQTRPDILQKMNRNELGLPQEWTY